MRGFRTDGIGLEIGPSHRPIAPRSEGFRVKVVDCMDREALIERYQGLGIDTSRIEEVDYVWSGERYAELMGGTELFDWIISSHSIEHVPDMVGFLNDCKDILKVGGILSLVIPDRRYMFDVERENSSLASVIDAHLRKDVNPTPGAVAEFNLRFSERAGKASWHSLSLARLFRSKRVNSLERSREAFREGLAAKGYLDIHVWCFTQRSFAKIFNDLRDLDMLSGLQMVSAPVSNKDEFQLSLKRVG